MLFNPDPFSHPLYDSQDRAQWVSVGHVKARCLQLGLFPFLKKIAPFNPNFLTQSDKRESCRVAGELSTNWLKQCFTPPSQSGDRCRSSERSPHRQSGSSALHRDALGVQTALKCRTDFFFLKRYHVKQ